MLSVGGEGGYRRARGGGRGRWRVGPLSSVGCLERRKNGKNKIGADIATSWLPKCFWGGACVKTGARVRVGRVSVG